MLEKSVEEGVTRAGIKRVFLFLRFLDTESGESGRKRKDN